MIDSSNSTEKAQHEKLVALVDNMYSALKDGIDSFCYFGEHYLQRYMGRYIYAFAQLNVEGKKKEKFQLPRKIMEHEKYET
jgi:hypothetical protein